MYPEPQKIQKEKFIYYEYTPERKAILYVGDRAEEFISRNDYMDREIQEHTNLYMPDSDFWVDDNGNDIIENTRSTSSFPSSFFDWSKAKEDDEFPIQQKQEGGKNILTLIIFIVLALGLYIVFRQVK